MHEPVLCCAAGRVAPVDLRPLGFAQPKHSLSDDAAQQVEQQMSGQRSEGMRPPLRDLLLHTSRREACALPNF